VFIARDSFAKNPGFPSSGGVQREIQFLTDSLTCTDHHSAETLNEHDIKSATWGKTLKVPRYIEFRDMLPKSKVGKLLRREAVEVHK
jgi:acyl-coenzyme A synthetase/AMP-(fatty) acid ligase